MGYVSDVALCLSGAAATRLNEALVAARQTMPTTSYEDIERFLKSALQGTDTDSGGVLYVWETIKWYDEFTEVGFLNRFVTSLDGEEYLFLRIGEDHDDNVSTGWMYDNPFDVRIVREIQFA